jgi:hypothetical protein
VAPDGTQLHAADALPHDAPGFDVGAGEDHLARLRLDPFGYRRRLLVELTPHPQQHAEGNHEQGC